MKLASFFNSIIDCFNKHNVKHLIVGGYAVNVYGYIRSTADLDIWIDKSDENLENLLYSTRLSFSEGYSRKHSIDMGDVQHINTFTNLQLKI
jgi:hypothetical protein